MKSYVSYQGGELEVEFSCGWQKTDNGAPIGTRLEEWWEPCDFQIEGVYILGHMVNMDCLSEPLKKELYKLADEIEFELP